MLQGEISEYPYTGTITRIVEGSGDEDDTESVIYDGVMDETMTVDDSGHSLQTASYIVTIPLTKDDEGNYIIPVKDDKIELVRYGQTLQLQVDNAEPSQLQGVSIYCTRSKW